MMIMIIMTYRAIHQALDFRDDCTDFNPSSSSMQEAKWVDRGCVHTVLETIILSKL